jgi:putative endonuclease
LPARIVAGADDGHRPRPFIIIARAGGRSSTRGRRMREERRYFVYILASEIGGTLYVGVTNDLIRRVYEHRTSAVPGFTARYSVKRLVYFEQYDDVRLAIQREKRLKKWNRAWKIRLIEEGNPNWDDLYPSIAHP